MYMLKVLFGKWVGSMLHVPEINGLKLERFANPDAAFAVSVKPNNNENQIFFY